MSALVEQRTGVRQPGGNAAAETPTRKALALVLAAVGIGPAVVAALGPLGTGVVDWRGRGTGIELIGAESR